MSLNRKLGIVDLSTGEIETKPIPLELRKKFIGGRGLDMYLLYNHTEPGIDALGPDNVALISAGLLCATLSSASARTHVAAKSPLTGAVGSTNMGGFFAPEMTWAGFHHLMLKGQAEEPVYIWVNDGEIEIRDASHLWGLSTRDTQNALQQELGPEVQVLCIGPAGENLVRYANVMNGMKNAGGRSGMGAVLGSKKVKAVVARGTMDVQIKHPEEALEYDYDVMKHISGTKFAQIMGKYGTMFIQSVTNSTGLVRTQNFQYNQLLDAEPIECEHIEDYTFGTAGCFGCIIHCRHRYIVDGIYDEGPEYTAQGAFGWEVGCNDFETVLMGNHLVNHWGLDILETGSMMAWAMELYEKGIITDKDTGGLKLEWGNEEVVLELIRQIAFREGIGDVLAEGPKRAAAKIGRDSLKYNIQVKGMSNLHSDERPSPALALGIATGTRGSDHLRSRPAIDLYHLPVPVLEKVYNNPVEYKGSFTSDYRDYEGKPWQVLWQEMMYMAIDCTGVCKYHCVFLSPNLMNFEHVSKFLHYNVGLELSPREVWEVAERCYNIERMFNAREGFDRKDDMLSDRYFDEPTKRGLAIVRGRTLDREKFEGMVDEYYELHGWDNNGVPTEETLERLGLDKEPSHLL
jgi:aldehyde:ferredoxin oxidoreductase